MNNTEQPLVEPEDCKPGPNHDTESIRDGNNKAKRTKTKRRAINALVKKAKKRNRK